MLRASLGYLLRHPWQLVLAVLGIAIGVAVIVAVDIANASSRTAYRLSVEALNGDASHQILGGPGGVDERLYAGLRVDGGLRCLAPVVTGDVVVGNTALGVLGVDPFAEAGFRRAVAPVEEGDDGRQPSLRDLMTLPGAAAMASTTADSLGIARGQTFAVRVGTRTADAVLVGVVDTDAAPGLTDLLVTDIATAQEWLAMPGMLSRIDVRVDDESCTSAAIRAALPPGV